MSIIAEGNAVYFLCRLVFGLLALVLIFGTAIPLVRSEAWWIRVFDFPRIQIAALIVLTLIGYAVLHLWGQLRPWEYAVAAAVGLGLIWQIFSIAPYTTFYPREMAESRAEADSNRISIFAYNVLHDNREVESLRNLIREIDPDIILLSETTRWWLDQLDGLDDEYPFTLFQPQENEFGMLVYSRLELADPQIRFLIEPEIPSLRTKVRLRSGTLITLYGVHPRPPGLHRPDKDKRNVSEESERRVNEGGEREDSAMRDAELLSIAREAKELGDVPVIVAGDFNDVAWSRTTHLFQRIGGLLDPRVGRGLVNTFSTKSFFLRFPLDHVFASQHFLLVDLRRLPDIGSDHFPMLAVFDYDPRASVRNEKRQPDADDKQEADEAIDQEKSTA
ncbi:MAG: endonuclease [Planctomycetaceae bacterium]|nr:MAG: endonuclease [Planctomycetaceae bacterium]